MAAPAGGAAALGGGEETDRVARQLGEVDGDSEQAPRRAEGPPPGGSKWIGTGGTSPFGAYGYNPEGVRVGQEESRKPPRGEGVGPARVPQSRRSIELGTRNVKVALKRLRKFAREGAAEELDLDDTIRSTARTPAGSTSRWCRSGTNR